MTSPPDACPLCALLANARRIASREQHVSDWIALGRQVVAMVDELDRDHLHYPEIPGGPRVVPRPVV